MTFSKPDNCIEKTDCKLSENFDYDKEVKKIIRSENAAEKRRVYYLDHKDKYKSNYECNKEKIKKVQRDKYEPKKPKKDYVLIRLNEKNIEDINDELFKNVIFNFDSHERLKKLLYEYII